MNYLYNPCGCTDFIDPEWGVRRNYKKCEHHQRVGGQSGIKHHEVMGAIKDGVVEHGTYALELAEPLNEMGVSLGAPRGAKCLEIGCGVGSYIPLLLTAGFDYIGIEPDAEIAELTNNNFDVLIEPEDYEGMEAPHPFDLIFCAHAFEHMAHAPDMMAKAFSQLKEGGRLVLIIPNDEDTMNPDHLWFFTQADLHFTLMRIGFQDIRTTMRRRVPQEQFIYAVAHKP